MAGLEKNRGKMQWKELPENVEMFCICVTQGIRNSRPVFTKSLQSVADTVASDLPESSSWPWSWPILQDGHFCM